MIPIPQNKSSPSKLQNNGTGRRKTSTARVYISKGTGVITINRRKLEDYFGRETTRQVVRAPLILLGLEKEFDVLVNVVGGVVTGQAGSIRHGLTRALIQHYEQDQQEDSSSDTSCRRILRKAGFVTRDPRQVERKKVGFKKARKKPQFSKR